MTGAGAAAMLEPAPHPPRAAATRAELVAASWETFSALLFAAAVLPSYLWLLRLPGALFLGSLLASWLARDRLLRAGARGLVMVVVMRALAWPLALLPVASELDSAGGGLVAALAFGIMAGAIRRASYRRFAGLPAGLALGPGLRPLLTEAATTAGILGGHLMLLFSVAFLRTQSKVIFRAWFDVVPALALVGTVGFALAVRPLTRRILEALRAGPSAPGSLLEQGLADARRLPRALAALNFVLWLVCTSLGAVIVRLPSSAADLLTQLAFAALFAWGVSFYQRAWVGDVCAPVVVRLEGWTGVREARAPATLRARMLWDFGVPLLFTCLLSFFASIALYRALARGTTIREDAGALAALAASFGLLVVAAGGVVARAARELSRPMTQLARDADRVAHGDLDAGVGVVAGPAEVSMLGESIEGMRRALSANIVALEAERAQLEARVTERTSELSLALEELKQAQLALLQGERLAAVGELAATLAHEIYNPLNAASGAAAPLEAITSDLRRMLERYRASEALLPATERAQLEGLRAELDLDACLADLADVSRVVTRATGRAVQIVKNLRAFARGPGEPAPTDLRACVEETLTLLSARLRQAGVDVVVRLDGLPLVTARSGELQQVLMNLFVNALWSLEQERPVAPAIVVEGSVRSHRVTLTVCDNGAGVAAEAEQKLFQPFFTTKPQGQGTGLGLSISLQIVRRHGGTLRHERPEGGGARFVVELPEPASAASSEVANASQTR